MSQKQITQSHIVSDGVNAELQIEVIDGIQMDTSVTLSGQFVVSGSSKDSFLKKLGELIDEYRI